NPMQALTLYTYAASQSSEKVRWALDSAGITYRERCLTPFLHRPLAPGALGSMLTPMPVLEGDGETIVDSTRILEWLEAHRGPFALIPKDPDLRTTVMNAESRFDHLAVHLLRWHYAALLQRRALAVSLWGAADGRGTALLLDAAFPLIRRVFARGL